MRMVLYKSAISRRGAQDPSIFSIKLELWNGIFEFFGELSGIWWRICIKNYVTNIRRICNILKNEIL